MKKSQIFGVFSKIFRLCCEGCFFKEGGLRSAKVGFFLIKKTHNIKSGYPRDRKILEPAPQGKGAPQANESTPGYTVEGPGRPPGPSPVTLTGLLQGRHNFLISQITPRRCPPPSQLPLARAERIQFLVFTLHVPI